MSLALPSSCRERTLISDATAERRLRRSAVDCRLPGCSLGQSGIYGNHFFAFKAGRVDDGEAGSADPNLALIVRHQAARLTQQPFADLLRLIAGFFHHLPVGALLENPESFRGGDIQPGVVMLSAKQRIPSVVQRPRCIHPLDGEQPFGLQEHILALPVGKLSLSGSNPPAKRKFSAFEEIESGPHGLADRLEVLGKGDEACLQLIRVAVGNQLVLQQRQVSRGAYPVKKSRNVPKSGCLKPAFAICARSVLLGSVWDIV